MSRFAGPSCKSILYCNPEQPPPTTATRNTPWGRPCLVNNELTFSAALCVTRISRSSPTRKFDGVLGECVVPAIMTQETNVIAPTRQSRPAQTKIDGGRSTIGIAYWHFDCCIRRREYKK